MIVAAACCSVLVSILLKYLKNMGITPKMSIFLVPLTKKEKSLNYLCTLNHTQNNEIY